MPRIVKAELQLDLAKAEAQIARIGALLESSMRQALAAGKGTGANFNQLTGALKKVSTSSTKTAIDVEKLKQEHQKTERQVNMTAAAYSRLVAAQVRVTKAAEDVNTATAKTRKENERALLVTAKREESEQRVAARALRERRRLERESERAARKPRTFGDDVLGDIRRNTVSRIADIPFDIAAFGLRTLVDQLKSAVSVAIEFETAFTGVGKTVDDVFEEIDGEFTITERGEELRAELLAISSQIPITITEIAKIAELGGQLGIETSGLDEFTETVAKLGATTNLSVELAATSLAKLANVLNIQPDEFEAVGSAIVDLGNNTATTEKSITLFAQRISGAGAVVGLSIADILGISAAFESIGSQSASSATAVQRALLAIQTAVNEGGEDLRIFGEVAFGDDLTIDAEQRAKQFAQLFEQDAAGAFTAFVEGLGRDTDSAAAHLDSLGLGTTRTVRSFLAIANAGPALADGIERSNTALEESSALNREAGLRFETTESKIQLLKNAWEQFKISLVDLGPIQQGIENLEFLARRATESAEILSKNARLFEQAEAAGVIAEPEGSFVLGVPRRGVGGITGADFTDQVTALREGREALGQEIGLVHAQNELLGLALFETSRLIAGGGDAGDFTPEAFELSTQAFTESGLALEDYIQTVERAEVITGLATVVEGSVDSWTFLADAILDGSLALEQIDPAAREALRGVAALADEFAEFDRLEDLRIRAAVEIDEADLGLGALPEGDTTFSLKLSPVVETDAIQFSLEQERFEILVDLGVEEGEARELAGLPDLEEAVGNLEGLTLALDAAEQQLAQTTAELAKSFLDANDPIEAQSIAFIDAALATGASQEGILQLIDSNSLLSESERVVIDNMLILEEERARLIELTTNEGLAVADAQAMYLELAQTLDLVVTAVIDTGAAVADSVKQFLDSSDATDAWAINLIDASVAAGATGDEVLELVEALGILSPKELEAAENASKFAIEQQNLLALAEAGTITWLEAAAAIDQLATSYGIATVAAQGFSAVQSTFVGGLTGLDTGGGGGGGGRVQPNSDDEFRQSFIDLASGDVNFEDVASNTEDFADSLFQLTAAAGASVDELLALGIATGKFDEEQGKVLLGLVASEKGLDAIAEAYVGGKINAEEAAAAATTLQEQIAAGAEIDLSAFNIQLGQANTAVRQVTQSVGGGGGAVDVLKDYRDALLAAADSHGANSTALLRTARLTETYTEAQLKSQLVQDGVNRAVEAYGELLADGFDPTTAVQNIGALEDALGGLNADRIAEFLDEAVLQGIEDPTVLTAAIENFLGDGDLTVAAAIALAITAVDDTEVEPAIDEAVNRAEDTFEKDITVVVKADIVDDISERLADRLDEADSSFESRVKRESEDLTRAVNDGFTRLVEDTEAERQADEDLLARDFRSPAIIEAEAAAGVSEFVANRDEEARAEEAAAAAAAVQDELKRGRDAATQSRISEALSKPTADDVGDALKSQTQGFNEFLDEDQETSIRGEVEVEVTPTLPETGFFDLGDQIDEVVEEERESTIRGNLEELIFSLQDITENTTYETEVDADLDTSDIQEQLDSQSYSVDVEVNVAEVGASSSGQAPASVPDGNAPGGVFAEEGGLLVGRSHEQGGIGVEAEGGEFIVSKRAVTSETLDILRRINTFGAGALPQIATEILDGFATQQVSLPSGLTNSGGGGGIDPLSSFFTQPTAQVPSSVNNSTQTSVDQSNNGTTVNNFYQSSGNGSNNSVLPGIDLPRL